MFSYMHLWGASKHRQSRNVVAWPNKLVDRIDPDWKKNCIKVKHRQRRNMVTRPDKLVDGIDPDWKQNCINHNLLQSMFVKFEFVEIKQKSSNSVFWIHSLPSSQTFHFPSKENLGALNILKETFWMSLSFWHFQNPVWRHYYQYYLDHLLISQLEERFIIMIVSWKHDWPKAIQ